MRIAFVTDALVPYSEGGAERRVHALASRLAERHDVHIVTWSFWGDARTVRRGNVTLHGVGRPRPFYGADGRRTVREGVAFAARLPRALARLRVDLVDVSATPYLPLYGAWPGTRTTGTPLVATWHEYWDEHWLEYLGERPLVARAARLGERFARRLADRRIAVSPHTAERLLGTADGGDEPTIVGNGVDAAAFATARPARERSDVIFVGRLIAEKGVDVLLRAVASIARDVPTIRCLIVGDGPERERLEGLALSLGLAERVTFLGRVEDGRLARLLRASKVLALPSTREGYGIVVVEAQAAGAVPVVVRSPLSAASDQIADGVDGILCEPTERGLADAIRGLLADPARHRRLATAAKRSAAARDWGRRAEELERVYEDVIARHRFRARMPRRSPWRPSRPRPVADRVSELAEAES